MNVIARIQLAGTPSALDYQNLHTTMARAGFTTTVPNTLGRRYELPHAEYFSNLYDDVESARDAAFAAAKSVWRIVEVLVSGGDICWEGLSAA